jgi:hypothetical protein
MIGIKTPVPGRTRQVPLINGQKLTTQKNGAEIPIPKIGAPARMIKNGATTISGLPILRIILRVQSGTITVNLKTKITIGVRLISGVGTRTRFRRIKNGVLLQQLATSGVQVINIF